MYDAIVLAGGSARRLGGVDKPQLDVGGVRLLDRVLAAVAGAQRRIVVGPQRDVAVPGPVLWRREQPPGGGPVAAIAAALDAVAADRVVVLAADLPEIAPAVPALLAALDEAPDAEVACLGGPGGRVNYLAAAWRTTALRRAIAAGGDPDGIPARRLIGAVVMIEVADPAGWGRDCDTWDELSEARRRAAADEDKEQHVTNPLDSWLDELAEALGVDRGAVDRDLLLDVAADAAHGVSRPSAPLTTFLVGLAAGRNGGDAGAVRAAAGMASRLAKQHEADRSATDT